MFAKVYFAPTYFPVEYFPETGGLSIAVSRGGHYGPPDRKKKKKAAEVVDHWPIAWATGLREWEKVKTVETIPTVPTVSTLIPTIPKPATISRPLIKTLAGRKTPVLGNVDLGLLFKSPDQRQTWESQRAARQQLRDEDEELMLWIGIIER